MKLPENTGYAMFKVAKLHLDGKISDVEKADLLSGFAKISDLYCDAIQLVEKQQSQIRFLESCMRNAQGGLIDKSSELRAIGQELSSAISLVESGVTLALTDTLSGID